MRLSVRTVARKSLTRGLDIAKIDKTPLICSVSYFKFGGLELSPSKPRCGEGTALGYFTSPHLSFGAI